MKYDILFIYLFIICAYAQHLYKTMLFNIKSFSKYFFTQIMKIGTHDGRFHCDQALACTMLRNYTNKFKDATIIRTRDPKLLEQCDVVVDVGGKYQPPRLLDHHQIQFQDTYPNYNVRLSSAGLVYLHFGQQVITNIIKKVLENQKDKLTFQPKVDQEIISQIKEKVYQHFIIYVDANDNGVSKINQKQISGVPTTLWSRVAKLNPMWWQQNCNQFQQFKKAMLIADEQLYSQVKGYLLGSLQTKGIVKDAFLKRNQIHQSGRVILLQKYVPWVKPVFEIEEQFNCSGQILYVLFPQKTGKKWRIQAVPLKQGAFQLRKGIKQEWRGIKDMEKLVNISGIYDIDFVHASGFVGGAVSRQSVIKMAQLSI